MNRLLLLLPLCAVLAGCDIEATAPPPGDSTPAKAAPGAPGMAQPATPKPTPAPGDWRMKGYRNPLEPTPKRR